jgi:hypothetical protein
MELGGLAAGLVAGAAETGALGPAGAGLAGCRVAVWTGALGGGGVGRASGASGWAAKVGEASGVSFL